MSSESSSSVKRDVYVSCLVNLVIGLIVMVAALSFREAFLGILAGLNLGMALERWMLTKKPFPVESAHE
jgi:hypothetical protein